MQGELREGGKEREGKRDICLLCVKLRRGRLLHAGEEGIGGSSLKLQCKQAKSITQDEAGTVDSAVRDRSLRYYATRTAIVCAYHLMLHYDYAR